MKVLLIYPNVIEHGDIPIALTVLAAVLKKSGHLVNVFDCSQYVPDVDANAVKVSYGMFKPAPLPPIPPPPRKNIENMEKDLVDSFKDFHADIVGITNTSRTYPLGLKCSRVIKKHYPDTLTVFGGIHPTISSDEVISEDCVDVVCVGEGEDALLELCDAMEAKKNIYDIKNLWIKDRKNPKNIYRNHPRPLKNLDTLPAQDFSGFHEYEFYRPLDGKLYKMMNTEISRGCIFKCHYCSNCFLQKLFKDLGNYNRRKSPEIAISHLKELKEKYGFNAIRFWDEDFTILPVSYLKEFSRLYKKEINLPFIVYAGTRTITEEKVGYLKDMGCITMAMAIESGNYWMRKNILNRDIKDEDIVRKYEIVKKSGIRVSAYNMIGLPFETRSMIFDTIYLNRRVDPATSSAAVYMPYPRTRLAEITEEFGLLKDTSDYDSLSTSLESPHLGKDDINGLARTFTLYTKIPEEFFPVLEKCEKDEELSAKLFPLLLKHLEEKKIDLSNIELSSEIKNMLSKAVKTNYEKTECPE